MACRVLLWWHVQETTTTGGELDFVYDTDSNGRTWWTTTTGSILATDRLDWDRPAEELRNVRFPAKFADRILRGDHIFDCPGTCNLAPDLSAPSLGYDACCWVATSKLPDLMSLTESVLAGKSPVGSCKDLLNHAYWQSHPAEAVHWAFAAFADVVANDTSCEGLHAGMCACCMHEILLASAGGCLSNLEPLCKKGRCTAPSCEDARPHCYQKDEAGRLARVYCPVTCGCHDAFSPQFLNAPEDGCPKRCSIELWPKQIAVRPCADAEAGSAELTAYAQTMMSSGVERSYSIGDFGQGLVATGCQAASIIGSAMACHDHLKILQFCPVTCGCKGRQQGRPQQGLPPLTYGCPASCPASLQLAAAGSSTP